MFNQSASPLPIAVSYGGNARRGLEHVGVGHGEHADVTVVRAVTGTTGQPTTVTGTLTNQVTGQGISGQTVTLTLNATQSCTTTTGSNGKASCSVTPNESAGTYPVTGSFAGNTTSTQLLPSTGHNDFVVTAAATSVTYTGATTATNGSSVTLSSTLTTSGTPLSGQSVVLSLGTGKTVQSCTATTTSSGAASCSISSVNQVAGSVSVTVSYTGNGYDQSASTSSTIKIANSSSGKGSGGGSGGGSWVAEAAGAATASRRRSGAGAAPALACDQSRAAGAGPPHRRAVRRVDQGGSGGRRATQSRLRQHQHGPGHQQHQRHHGRSRHGGGVVLQGLTPLRGCDPRPRRE